MPGLSRTTNILHSISGSTNIPVKLKIMLHFYVKDNLNIFAFIYVCISTEFVLLHQYVYHAVKINIIRNKLIYC